MRDLLAFLMLVCVAVSGCLGEADASDEEALFSNFSGCPQWFELTIRCNESLVGYPDGPGSREWTCLGTTDFGESRGDLTVLRDDSDGLMALRIDAVEGQRLGQLVVMQIEDEPRQFFRLTERTVWFYLEEQYQDEVNVWMDGMSVDYTTNYPLFNTPLHLDANPSQGESFQYGLQGYDAEGRYVYFPLLVVREEIDARRPWHDLGPVDRIVYIGEEGSDYNITIDTTWGLWSADGTPVRLQEPDMFEDGCGNSRFPPLP